eukprot:568964-Karenia_brevis.AAC.1
MADRTRAAEQAEAANALSKKRSPDKADQDLFPSWSSSSPWGCTGCSRIRIQISSWCIAGHGVGSQQAVTGSY